MPPRLGSSDACPGSGCSVSRWRLVLVDTCEENDGDTAALRRLRRTSAPSARLRCHIQLGALAGGRAGNWRW
jgi:hypothetical protein